MRKKSIFQRFIELFKSIFSDKYMEEECIKNGHEKGIFCYKDEGRTKEMLSYSEVIEMLKNYDTTRIEPLESALGYEDSRVVTFDFVQFKKYLGHVENLSKKANIRMTGISFIASAKKHDKNGKQYSGLLYIPSTTIQGDEILYDPLQSATLGKLVTFKEMLAKHGYNWIYDNEADYKEGKRKDYNYSLKTVKKQEANFKVRNGDDTGIENDPSGLGNRGTISPPL